MIFKDLSGKEIERIILEHYNDNKLLKIIFLKNTDPPCLRLRIINDSEGVNMEDDENV
jgi:hypothetical protein